MGVAPTSDREFKVTLGFRLGQLMYGLVTVIRLPTNRTPIPLRNPDPNAVLNLQAALNAIYDEAGYDLSIDYTQAPPPPAFNGEDIEWIDLQIQSSL
uniref:DUF4058 family protein n=4 Tax=Nostocales TaxID=1161 RepID=A0A0C1R9I2_9CYAN